MRAFVILIENGQFARCNVVVEMLPLKRNIIDWLLVLFNKGFWYCILYSTFAVAMCRSDVINCINNIEIL